MKLKKLFLLLASVFVFFVIAFIGFSTWVMEMPPVSEKAVGTLALGMTREQVISKLGKPDGVNEYKGGDQWVYSDDWKWIMFYVNFSADGTVASWKYDR